MEYQNGDIIFMRLDIPQINPLKIVSKSDYTHLGIILVKQDSVFVYEAAGNVNLVHINKWLSRRSKDSTIVVKRVKKDFMVNDMDKKIVKEAFKYKGLFTDIIFNWSDSLMYNSELIWKIYDRGAGIKLCDTKKMKDWNNSDKKVLDRLKAKYGIQNPFVMEDTVVSVDDIFNSEKLETVFSGGTAQN